jgi:2-dehydro-3-deoxy-L-rhamnonate dehydrogenase (NAD+)
MAYLDLSGRVAVVTGGARGIGLAIVRRLAEAGARPFIADVDEANARRVAAEVVGPGGVVEAVGCDVADAASVRAMVARVLERAGQIDILVNNAGIVGHAAPISEQGDEDWDRMLAIDLTGVFYCCRAVVPHMLARGGGRIINIASIAGKEGNPNMVPYSAAKAGVIGLTKALAKEVARQGVLVNAIAPALIQTGMVDELTPEQVRYLTDRIPLGRLGRAEEVAALVHWLASDDASFSTGAVFDLSGGRATY